MGLRRAPLWACPKVRPETGPRLASALEAQVFSDVWTMRGWGVVGTPCCPAGAFLNCKACNTRIPAVSTNCPNCGRELRPGRRKERKASKPPARFRSDSGPGALASSSVPSSVPSPVPSVRLDHETSQSPALSAEEDMEMSGTPTDQKPRARAAAKKRSASPRSQTKADQVEEVLESPAVAATALAMPVETAQIKYLIGERPELLESDLSVYIDAKGQDCGVGFQTDVGEIDLLARSASGDWVVVMVAGDQESGDVIPSLLQRLGWVRKHLCGVNQQTRGILLLDRMDEATRYTAAALEESVSFLTWRLSLQFEPLPK